MSSHRRINNLPTANVTSLLQSMDELVIKTMKHHYRRQPLKKLLLVNENEKGMLASYKTLNLNDCA